MIKVCFLSHHFESPETFLNSILKMTPGRKGVWKNIEAVTNPKDADYYAIFDGYNHELLEQEKKAIYFCQHPYTPYSPKHKTWSDKKALLKFPLKHYLNPGEWWIEKDYDELINMECPIKRKLLICVMTYQTHHSMYSERHKFMERFITNHPKLFVDLYGRPKDKFESNEILKEKYRGVLGIENYNPLKGEHIVGKNVIGDYVYSIEIDVGPCENYFSERFYDSLLMWTLPFYWGCTNVHKYIPSNAFRYFDIYKNGEDIFKEIGEDYKIPDFDTIKKARDLLLNKYQTWSYVHDIVNNIDKYKEQQKLLGIV